jgi:hypothetical protein
MGPVDLLVTLNSLATASPAHHAHGATKKHLATAIKHLFADQAFFTPAAIIEAIKAMLPHPQALPPHPARPKFFYFTLLEANERMTGQAQLASLLGLSLRSEPWHDDTLWHGVVSAAARVKDRTSLCAAIAHPQAPVPRKHVKDLLQRVPSLRDALRGYIESSRQGMYLADLVGLDKSKLKQQKKKHYR